MLSPEQSELSPKPFDESIVGQVKGITFREGVVNDRARAAEELTTLAELTRRTAIPANHDVIAAAFRDKMEELYLQVLGRCWEGLFTHIENEKVLCAAKAAKAVHKVLGGSGSAS